MLTDDEKYLFSEKRTIEEVHGYCDGNVRDIIAIGFDPAKTFVPPSPREEIDRTWLTWHGLLDSYSPTLTSWEVVSTAMSSGYPSISHSTKQEQYVIRYRSLSPTS